MKKILFVLLLGMSIFACSKSGDTTIGSIPASQVPAAVISTYNARYPAASGQIEWETEHGDTYKVKFFIGSQRWQAQFKADGTFIDEKKI